MIKIRSTASILTLILASACSSPDLGPALKDAQSLLDASITQTEASLKARAAVELAEADFTAASAGQRIVDLTSACLIANADLALSVDDCRVKDLAKPLDTSANATQVLLAQSVMRSYFAVLSDLNATTSPADIRAKTTSLFSAFDSFAETQNSAQLERLRLKAQQRGPAIAAITGFAADRARINAMRRIARRADPVLEDLVRGMQPVFLDLGDTTADARLEVTLAFKDYDTAFNAQDVQAQLDAATDLRQKVEALHVSEANSPLRQLYIIRDLHAGILAALNAPASLAELDALTAQIAEIATLLEDA